MKKLPLTIIILTNRVDERFTKALESSQFAADVLVVTDGVEAAVAPLRTQYTFQIVPLDEPLTDFSKVRNAALRYAQEDWVFFLDSDEVISPQSISEITRLITTPSAAGYGVLRSDIFLGKELEYGEAGNQQLVRLGKKEALKFSGMVHEVADVAGLVRASSVKILHYSHPSISEFITKVARYAEQVATERARQPISFGKLVAELLFYPPAKFLHGLLLRGGIADGWQGVVYAACMSLHSLLVRIYLYEKIFLKNR